MTDKPYRTLITGRISKYRPTAAQIRGRIEADKRAARRRKGQRLYERPPTLPE